MSESDIYKNIPAVIANIHCWAVSSVESCTPMMKPMKAVRDDKRLAITALQKDMPLFNKTAKSPVKSKRKPYGLSGVKIIFYLK